MQSKLYTMLLLFISLNVNAEQKNPEAVKKMISPQEKVASICSEYQIGKSMGYQNEFIQKLKKEVLFHEDIRAQFAKDLVQKKIKGCENALLEYMNKILSYKEFEPKQGDQAFLSLALLAKIPEANKVIEKEIDKGLLSSWIDILKESNDKAYMQSLRNWVFKVGKTIREIDKASLVDSSEYGKITLDNIELKNPEKIRIWTPILMNRYLTENITRNLKLSQEEFSNLNIIYAASTTSYREVFGDQIAKTAKNNIQKWILSYRVEPSWAQFRLFPLMEKIGGGEIKREVIWISKYHQNEKMRAVANNTLDKLAIENKR